MTVAISDSVDLRLPLLPDIRNVTPALYQELLDIYNTIRNLSVTLDSVIGATEYSASEREEVLTQDARTTVVIETFSSLYATAEVDMQYGQLVSLNTGVARLSVPDADIRRWPVGFVAEESVTAGNLVKVCTRGVIGINGVVPGALYYASATTAGGIASGATVNAVPIAFGLRANAMFFHGYCNTLNP